MKPTDPEYPRYVFYSYQRGRMAPWLYEIWEQAFDKLVDNLYLKT